ncbi:hypothetical protein LTS10_005828 [Elasticomyces elasticus]|nr:hypothetical protein LTS10_005828 [Elasticomyces elasticus]
MGDTRPDQRPDHKEAEADMSTAHALGDLRSLTEVTFLNAATSRVASHRFLHHFLVLTSEITQNQTHQLSLGLEILPIFLKQATQHECARDGLLALSATHLYKPIYLPVVCAEANPSGHFLREVLPSRRKRTAKDKVQHLELITKRLADQYSECDAQQPSKAH